MRARNYALTALITEQLLRDNRLCGLAIDVSCVNGCVLILGRVDLPEQKELVSEIVRGVAGVRTVMNHLTVVDSQPNRHVVIHAPKTAWM